MSTSNGKSLRFASLIRVSTERQEKRGESLHTQREANERDVAALGGRIVERYGGQEHGTPGWEKKEVDRLLTDARRGRFDAIIVQYADRWSRDNAKSAEGLKVFKDHGIRFFIGTAAQDLYRPEIELFLGMQAVIGQFQADQQTKKSIENKLARLGRGIPAAGGYPFGRSYDRARGVWAVDPDKLAMVKDAAARVLAGESLEKVAPQYGREPSYLARVLKFQCGASWFVSFDVPRLGIKAGIALAVPRLLGDATIRAVTARLKANRTYAKKPPRSEHEYALRGKVFCAGCGTRLTGQPTKRKDGRIYTYYVHHKRTDRTRACPFSPRPKVPAKTIEGAVIGELFHLRGNPAAIERAVRAAIPDCKKLMEKERRLTDELAKIKKTRNRVLGLIERDALTDAQAEEKLRELKNREAQLIEEQDQLRETLAAVPQAESVRVHMEEVRDTDGTKHVILYDDSGDFHTGGNDIASSLELADSPADIRELIESSFPVAKLPDGTIPGVYVTPGAKHGQHRDFAFEMRGRITTNGEVSRRGH
jgi:site-specific DNA recombinase